MKKLKELRNSYAKKGLIQKPSNYALIKYLINSTHELGEREEEVKRKEKELINSYHEIKEELGNYKEEISFSHRWFIITGVLVFIMGYLIGSLF